MVDGGFVAVKADREKRPDIDAVFMAATTALTGHGGWPMTCFLTPDGEPLYCGAHSQLPAVLEAVSQAWTSQRDHVLPASGLGRPRLRGPRGRAAGQGHRHRRPRRRGGSSGAVGAPPGEAAQGFAGSRSVRRTHPGADPAPEETATPGAAPLSMRV